MLGFSKEDIKSWNGFLRIRKQLAKGWIFRGQPGVWPLKPSLERSCEFFGVSLHQSPAIEKQMIRDFRRQYVGDNRDIVLNDTLYCMTLMQHYGSPTRLMDWTYSPYVAAFFALESCESECEIWCINHDWCTKESEIIVPKLKDRGLDYKRKDELFVPFFLESQPYLKFVRPINPLLLHQRLIIQQGVFLCPGNIENSFVKNLKALKDWNKENHIIRINFKLTKNQRNLALLELHRMNIHRASLFPGLDGFAQSLKQKVVLFEQLNI